MTLHAEASWWQRDWSVQLSGNSGLVFTCYSGHCFWHGDKRPFLSVALSVDLSSVWQAQPPSLDNASQELLNLSFAVWEGVGLPSAADLYERCLTLIEGKKIFAHGIIEQLANECSQNLLLASFFHAHQPVQLSSVSIPKPWGKEVWYSGVEKRGVCKVRTAEQKLLALPYFEVFFGFALHEARSALVLLKELKPFDEPFYGELYTELHTEKSEIYLVSELGPKVCPGQLGFVKLGLKETYGEPKLLELKETLLQYEALRAKIDQVLEQNGHVFSSPADLEELRAFDLKKQSLVAAKLLEQEQELYKRVSDFFKFVPLKQGDVVNVPTHTPHALQPGVSVIEFQTPSYERKILASNQKVLTQANWDVEEAVALMQQAQATQKQSSQGAADHEIIASFDDLFVVKLEIINASFAVSRRSPTVSRTDCPDVAPDMPSKIPPKMPVVGMVVSGKCGVRLLNSSKASATLFFAGNAFVLPQGKFLLEACGHDTERCLLILASSNSFELMKSRS